MYASAKVAARLAPLFAGYDADAYTLPADLLAARGAVQRLQAAVTAEPPTPAAARDQLVHDMVDAARTDAPLPALTEYHQATARHADWMTRSLALQDAVGVAEGQLQLTDEIITEHLRPALADVERDLARLASVLPEGVTDRFLSSPSATQKARQAWSDLEHVARRYEAIMRAHSMVTGHAQHEDDGEWAWCENLVELWPLWRQPAGFTPGNKVAPWPTDPRERLLWLSHHGAQLVVLTRDERTERFQEKYGEAIARQRQHRHNAQAFGAALS